MQIALTMCHATKDWCCQGTFAGSELLLSGNVTRRIAMPPALSSPVKKTASVQFIKSYYDETMNDVKHQPKSRKPNDKLTLISKAYLKD